MASPKDIPVIADIYDLKLTSPDWMMEFISAGELEIRVRLEQVKRHLDAMKPKLGSCLVLIGSGREFVARRNYRRKSARLSPGFDQAMLQAVVDALVV